MRPSRPHRPRLRRIVAAAVRVPGLLLMLLGLLLILWMREPGLRDRESTKFRTR